MNVNNSYDFMTTQLSLNVLALPKQGPKTYLFTSWFKTNFNFNLIVFRQSRCKSFTGTDGFNPDVTFAVQVDRINFHCKFCHRSV